MQHEVITSEKVPFTFQIAGLGSRFLAILVDFILVVALIGAGVGAGMVLEIARGGVGVGVILIWRFVVITCYFLLFEWLWFGQTPGKKLIGIRVIQWDGTNITFFQSALRNLLRIVDILPGFFGVGALVALSNREHCRLGDLAANTLVVHLEAKPRPSFRAILAPSEEQEKRRVVLQQATDQLSRNQKETILDLCARRDQIRFRARTRLFSAIAKYFQTEKNLEKQEHESDEKFVSQMATVLDSRRK